MHGSTIAREVVEDIIHKEVIRAGIREVFRALVDGRIVDEWGGGPARIQPRPGGRYSLWDGEMSGVVREVETPFRLVYTLRESSWEDNCLDSLVTWTLREVARGTEITLRHTGLPSRKIRDIHFEGWGDYFLGPIKAYLERMQR